MLVLVLGLGLRLTLTLTLKQHSLKKKKIDPDPAPTPPRRFTDTQWMEQCIPFHLTGRIVARVSFCMLA